jgi:hypothetical protein
MKVIKDFITRDVTTGERAVWPGEHPFSQRVWHGGGQACPWAGVHGMRCYSRPGLVLLRGLSVPAAHLYRWSVVLSRVWPGFEWTPVYIAHAGSKPWTSRGEVDYRPGAGLQPSVRRNLSSELGELRERVVGARADRAIEGEQLSRLTMAISDALVNLNMLLIQFIPAQS